MKQFIFNCTKSKQFEAITFLKSYKLTVTSIFTIYNRGRVIEEDTTICPFLLFYFYCITKVIWYWLMGKLANNRASLDHTNLSMVKAFDS